MDGDGLNNGSATEAYQYAVKLLAKRDYSEYKLRAKLKQKFSNSAWADYAVTKVQGLGYQCDERYVESFVRYAVGQSKGPLWIKAKLREKGLCSKLVEKQLQATDVDWSLLACEQLARKFPLACADNKDKSRRFRFLVARGFDSSVVMRSLEQHEQLLVTD